MWFSWSVKKGNTPCKDQTHCATLTDHTFTLNGQESKMENGTQLSVPKYI